MIVVNEIHDFEEIPPQVQYFVVFGSQKASATAGAFFVCISMPFKQGYNALSTARGTF
jgi:hypothetical protein